MVPGTKTLSHDRQLVNERSVKTEASLELAAWSRCASGPTRPTRDCEP